MDNYQGDLTDILRATSGSLSQQPDHQSSSSSCWEFDQPLLITTTSSSPTPPLLEESGGGRVVRHLPAASPDFFGDPFCYMRDPLLHELDMSTNSIYFESSASGNNNNNTTTSTTTTTNATKVHEGSCNNINMFSRIQISRPTPIPNNKLPLPPPPPPLPLPSSSSLSPPLAGFKMVAAASGLVPSDHRVINVSGSKSCLIDNNNHNNSGPVQISPRNLGIKRRKSQAKKVVCIPAPAAPNSRPSGEVVPSDLWAWRKYGQKPIKGSPYPRGYYRCSSSKGCSARKQVERSRTDPNMLVITYTSEHNHPWPTQRNALAGSTRTQPPKSSINNYNNVGSKIGSPTTSSQKKEDSSNDDDEAAALSPPPYNNNVAGAGAGAGASSSGGAHVKEEVEEDGKRTNMDHHHQESSNDQLVLDEGFSYRPAMADHHQDFFADLGEIDGDPLELLFSSSQGFNISDHQVEDGGGGQQKQGNKGGGLDPYGLFDWSSVDSQNPTPFGGSQ